MALSPKSPGDELPAVDWNTVIALAELAMRGTNNLSDLADIVAARGNLGLATVAATGDYADLSGLLLDADDLETAGMSLVDAGMEVIYRFTPTQLEALGFTITAAGAATFGSVAAPEMTLDSAVIFDNTDGPDGLHLTDAGMEVFGEMMPEATSHSAEEILARDAANKAAAAQIGMVRADYVCLPLAKYNLVAIGGQSLGQGAEGQPVLSTAAKYGNLMLGDIAASQYNTMPNANNATPPTFQVTGSPVFNPLVATGYNEISVHGALNTYRRMTLHHRGVTSDANHLMVGATVAVGGQSIAALSKGASPNLYNRYPSLMSQAHTAATNAGGDFLVPAFLWMQGESNQTTDKATYLAALRQLISDVKADTIAETGQEDPPAIFMYQTTAPNQNFDNTSLGVQMAQLECALNDNGVFMVGPNYPYPDSNNLHLPSNSYRWMGSMFGKVMFRVLTLGQRWKPLHIRRATLRGREILIDYHVPHPPLVFENPWLQDGWFIGETTTGGTNTQYAVPDKGFTVRTAGGTDLTVSSVAIVSDTQILITLAAAPGELPNLFYANGRQSHFGHGCVRDSDPTLADDVWTHVSGRTNADTNAALLGQRYPLPNWAVAQFLAVES